MNQTDDPAIEFLKGHRLGTLATGRRDGSPQQALIAYNFDGSNIVIATGADAAKTKNLRKRPRASIAVMDGPKVVVVYGNTEIVSGEEADKIRASRLQPPRPGGDAPARPAPHRAQSGERIVIRMSPEKIIANRLEG